VFGLERINKALFRIVLGLFFVVVPGAGLVAGGGLVLEGDVCIIKIDFYSAHFTAYQPNTSANTQFCRNLPDAGETIFVLDYLHQSLKEVPVSFRIIRDVTGLGRFVKLKHVEAIDDIEQHTVFYQPPVVRTDASFKIEYDFIEEGAYIGVVSAGHPTNDTIYTAVFPFEVGGSGFAFTVPLFLLLGGAAFFTVRRLARSRLAVPEKAAA
jgi:hypothetical protein